MVNQWVNAGRILVCAVLVVQLTGCGTIMYPERKGQKSGKIDAGVAVLDGIGLLLFIIPGVIAFAVDFNNGTIYLPGTSRSSLEQKKVKKISFNVRHSSNAVIERIIKQETGYDVRLDQDNLQITELKSLDDMAESFAKIPPAGQDGRVALLEKK